MSLTLPESLRSELKEPFGPIYTDTAALLGSVGEPLVTVGDVVTYHVLEAGTVPTLALVDERTERSAVDEEIAQRLQRTEGFDEVLPVPNPAGELTVELVRAIREAIEAAPRRTLIEVDGEEDLAALPALVILEPGASVVYGQPGEGMVHVDVDESAKRRASDILDRMDGNGAVSAALDPTG